LLRDIHEFNKRYQTRTNIVNDEKCDYVADSHSILVRSKNHFSQLFNIRGVNDVRQRKIHTEGQLVPESSAFEVELVVVKLKSHITR
jgi:hypothetical protein